MNCEACGAPLSLECEHDENKCVSCQCEQALGVPKPPAGTIHPIFAGLCQPFSQRSA